MVMIKRVLALLGSGALAILLLRQAETAAQAVRDGVQLCLTSVVPALFPFFAVSSLLVALGAAEAAGRALARPFGRLFRCGGAGCAALLLGLVGGYPVGARTAAELVRRGELSPAEGARLLTFCNNAGPAFAIGVAGVSVFGSARTGAWLYLLHCTAALLTGLLFCRRPLPVTAMPKRPVPPQTGLTGQFLRAVEGAVSAMARVCGFVVFFLVLLRLAEGLIGPLPPLAAGVLELTNGIGADEVMECSGAADSPMKACKMARKTGKVALIATYHAGDVMIPANTVNFNELTIVGSKANPNVSEQVLHFFSTGAIQGDKLVTHTFPLEDYEKAVDIFEHKKDGSIKVVINP